MCETVVQIQILSNDCGHLLARNPNRNVSMCVARKSEILDSETYTFIAPMTISNVNCWCDETMPDTIKSVTNHNMKIKQTNRHKSTNMFALCTIDISVFIVIIVHLLMIVCYI